MDAARHWFETRGMQPFPFQEEVWRRFLAGESGLVHAPTGFGKSLSAWMGPLIEAQSDPASQQRPDKRADAPPLSVVWVTPVRALGADLVRNLAQPARDLAPGWLVEARTGDTTSTERGRQARRLPTALVTTPESLTLLLSHEAAPERFAHLSAIVVDEWHELFGTKRGVQTELALARLRRLAPGARTWGLSATLGNLDEAKDALVGPGRPGALVRGDHERPLEISTVVPDSIERFPWAGHMGLRLLDEVCAELDRARAAIVFTNTRAQAERWYQAISYARYERRDEVGLHHGSLDRETRADVEGRLARGDLWTVVATSSLDLGVDFTPVDLVVQVGSPKGIARLAQRAGRSGHRPGATSRLVQVPTNALELVEFAAARDGLARGEAEPKEPMERPLDVLAQHIVTVAASGPANPEALLAEVRETRAFQSVTDEEWAWCLEFCSFGGEALSGYERYARVVRDAAGRLTVRSKRVARDHRLNIGTIAGYGSLEVAYRGGKKLGSVEELFLAKLKPGQAFTFGGKALELVDVKEGRAYVRNAKAASPLVPRWMGGRMPLSIELSAAVRRALDRASHAVRTGESTAAPELDAALPIFALQAELSRVPGPSELLIERVRTRDGDHAFLFPLEGRLVHEGLAALLAYRATRLAATTVHQAVSDWGIELTARRDFPVPDDGWAQLLSPKGLYEDILACMDAVGLARRHFREIARVAGLVSQGLPGQRKGQRQLQASAGLVFDVLVEHDPENLLLEQARREVLERTLEFGRLQRALESLRVREVRVERPPRLTPFAFPLFAERVRERVSSESWEDRVRAMAAKLEDGAAAR
ncbi:MAG: ligase-associated DNA damage response DEXH box helicase [Planctomycetota bacterium]